ncbi:caspase, EACC1-associated type [Microcoleus sp. B9-D4]|uniref:caspase, EACC1-associated type n=1 Tax=Microcoleus sp. B9-D4 TaxID=2818711 RepID=UPI002FD46BA6
MAKVALLIGVSEYQHGFNKLPGVLQDVKAMQRVLQNPKMGGFDVRTLENPTLEEIRRGIASLFSGCQRNDVVLLYFSGHGITDNSGNLYFAIPSTKKEEFQSTGVEASFVHKIMENSASKRQVVILDCCFSGAFPYKGLSTKGLTKEHSFIDLMEELGGEGRAVLTSTNAWDYSFGGHEEDLSIYTSYLVEGIETGAADRDEDGWISVDELHQYTKNKVQKAAPAMKPTITALKEGYRIQLAKASINDPKGQYRRKVEHWVNSGYISDIARERLNRVRDNLLLNAQDAKVIENEVLKPFKEHEQKLKKYREEFVKAIHWEYPISNQTRNNLNRLKQSLQLTDEKIALIENRIIEELQKKKQVPWKIPCLSFVIGMIIGTFVPVPFFLSYINSRQSLVDSTLTPGFKPQMAATFDEVKNVPEGRFSYGGTGAWTPIHPKLDSEIQNVHNQFNLEFNTTDKQGKLEVGSRESINRLLDGELDFALSNLPISDKDKSVARQKGFAIEQIPVSKNGVAVAVNPTLNISELTIDKLRDIYTGKIRNWQEINGPNIKINIYTSGGNTNSSSDWIKSTLKIENQELTDLTSATNANEAFNKVAKDPGGITLSSAPLVVPQCRIKALPLGRNGNKFVPPYQQSNFVSPDECNASNRNRVNIEAIYNGDYPLTNELYIVIKRNGQKEEDAGTAYANLVKTKEGQEIIKKLQETGNYER